MSEEVVSRLKDIFFVIFELDSDADPASIRQMNTPKWDSMATVSLVAAIENEFGINIDIAESLSLTSFQATALLLEEKLQ